MRWLRGGVEIASHGVSHADLRTLPDARVLDELCRSRELLSSAIERSVSGFAYPFGAYDDRVADLVRRAAYDYAYTCRQHRAVRPGDDPFRLCRIEINHHDDLPRFRAKLAGEYAHVYSTWYRLNPKTRAWLD